MKKFNFLSFFEEGQKLLMPKVFLGNIFLYLSRHVKKKLSLEGKNEKKSVHF